MELIVGPLITLSAFAMIFGIVYMAITARNRENMAMIESGMNPRESESKKHNNLRVALLALTIPIGILVGNFTHTVFGMDPEPAAVVFAFLFGGIGLTATYFIQAHLDKNNTKEL